MKRTYREWERGELQQPEPRQPPGFKARFGAATTSLTQDPVEPSESAEASTPEGP